MSDDQTISVYGGAVARYTGTPMLPEHIAALGHFAASVRPNGRVLDLGCGPGMQAETLVAAGLDVDAVDATPAFVQAALSRGLNARVAVFEDLPGDKIYDGIWASFSLLHAPRDSVPGHVARLAGALAPGGIFFLGMKTGSGEARDDLGRFYSYFSVEELHDMLESAGLRITQTVVGSGKGLSGTDDTYTLVHATLDG